MSIREICEYNRENERVLVNVSARERNRERARKKGRERETVREQERQSTREIEYM